MQDSEQQLKEIREELDQKYLKYLELKKKIQCNKNTTQFTSEFTSEFNSCTSEQDIYTDIYDDLCVILETNNATKTFGAQQEPNLKNIIIKETYYDRYGKKNIPKIPRASNKKLNN